MPFPSTQVCQCSLKDSRAIDMGTSRQWLSLHIRLASMRKVHRDRKPGEGQKSFPTLVIYDSISFDNIYRNTSDLNKEGTRHSYTAS
jgi:hypothetical protein